MRVGQAPIARDSVEPSHATSHQAMVLAQRFAACLFGHPASLQPRADEVRNAAQRIPFVHPLAHVLAQRRFIDIVDTTSFAKQPCNLWCRHRRRSR